VTTTKIKVCEQCGLLFLGKKSGGHNQRYCSKKCQKVSYAPTRRMLDKKRSYRQRGNALHLQLKKYGLTMEDYGFELDNQNYVCAICGQPETSVFKGTVRRLSVDHNHKTGCYRGLLCGRCNKAIGMFKDDIAILKQAIQYLERHKDPRDNT